MNEVGFDLISKITKKDWVEDFIDENGLYQNRCIFCKTIFYGHKNRVVCRLCKTIDSDVDKNTKSS